MDNTTGQCVRYCDTGMPRYMNTRCRGICIWDVAEHKHGTCMQDAAELLRNIQCHMRNHSDHCGCECYWGNKTNTKHHTEPKQCKGTMSYKVQLCNTCAECLFASHTLLFIVCASKCPHVTLHFLHEICCIKVYIKFLFSDCYIYYEINVHFYTSVWLIVFFHLEIVISWDTHVEQLFKWCDLIFVSENSSWNHFIQVCWEIFDTIHSFEWLSIHVSCKCGVDCGLSKRSALASRKTVWLPGAPSGKKSVLNVFFATMSPRLLQVGMFIWSNKFDYIQLSQLSKRPFNKVLTRVHFLCCKASVFSSLLSNELRISGFNAAKSFKSVFLFSILILL